MYLPSFFRERIDGGASSDFGGDVMRRAAHAVHRVQGTLVVWRQWARSVLTAVNELISLL